MKFKNFIIFLAILICLTGCSIDYESGCRKGIITSMSYRPCHTSLVFNGKTVIPIHHNERWTIELDNSWTFRVSEDDFKNLNIGDEVEINCMRQIEDGNEIKLS